MDRRKTELWFRYRTPSEKSVLFCAIVEGAYRLLLDTIELQVPDGVEKEQCLLRLKESKDWALTGIKNGVRSDEG